MKRKIPIVVLIGVILIAVICYFTLRRPREIVLTGIVTTDEVIVSSEIQGRMQQLLVKQGDAVTNGELLAQIQPEEWKADMAFYANTEQQSAAQVAQAEADLRFQESQTSNQIWQAEANLASAHAQVIQAEADLDNASSSFKREEDLFKRRVDSEQAYDSARAAFEGNRARVDSLRKQTQAAEAALAMAKSNADQVAARRAALQAMTHQFAAAGAQREKAGVRLGYTEIRAPMDGTVDVRAALQGEVVNPGQGIITLINPDDLWVRADVEESYIGRIRLGQSLQVRLPSGEQREGTVFFRGVDADYATQRDVSRAKRDIKTFEIRLRCDNRDRSLAVGMTAYVLLPLGEK